MKMERHGYALFRLGVWLILCGIGTGCWLVPNDRQHLTPGLPAVKIDELPSAVVAACRTQFPGQEIVQAAAWSRAGNKKHYAIGLGSGTKPLQWVIISEDGIVVDERPGPIRVSESEE